MILKKVNLNNIEMTIKEFSCLDFQDFYVRFSSHGVWGYACSFPTLVVWLNDGVRGRRGGQPGKSMVPCSARVNNGSGLVSYFSTCT
jgi:hypothetical protein